jgi:DNA-binding NtrC family response regulator
VPQEATVPQHALVSSVHSIRVEVLEGPDAGHSRLAGPETESDQVTVGTAAGNLLTLTDPTVSRYHLELGRDPSGVLVVDHGSTNGTLAGGVRIQRAVVPSGTVLRLGGTAVRVSDGLRMPLELFDGETLCGLHGSSPVMRRLMAQIKRVARTDVPVLLIGESGTGKELIARALHELGARAREPFVTVDCGSLAPTLVASELFGHERGSFTGAEQQHQGAFERAHGGTVFLDELGELPASLQPALLGVLERRRFRRVGGRSDITVDVRIVSATHRDLRAEVNAGTFRLDLYYRIAVVLMKVPALRERPEDLPLLVNHFLRECGHAGAVEALFNPGTMEALGAHHWPGNVRELRNMIETTVAMGEAPRIEDAISGPGGASAGGEQARDPYAGVLGLSYKEARSTVLRQFERRYLAHLVEKSGGNVSRAARDARMDRSHLIDLLRLHEIK